MQAHTTQAFTRTCSPTRGHTPAQVREKIAAAYAQLFHGDPATQSLYFPSGKNEHGGLAYILDAGDHDVRTEGMSYGMMIAVQLDHKQEFDALWNWARTYMYVGDPASPSFGYYAWSCRADGTHKSDTPAPDGEEYFAMALYFAAGRWSGGQGTYDYRARADELLHTMLQQKTNAWADSVWRKRSRPRVRRDNPSRVLSCRTSGPRLHRPELRAAGLL